MAAPYPLNPLHPATREKLDYDRDVRSLSPAPAPTLGGEIGALHDAISMAGDQLHTLISALSTLSHPEAAPAACPTTEDAPVPEAVAGVREARRRIESLTARMSDVCMRLAV